MVQLAWSRPAPELLLTRDGGDPLGLRAYANRLARELCPGLTQTTRMIRGFSLLALGLQFALDCEDGDVNDGFLRFERLWVVAQVHHFGDRAVFAGRRRATRLLDSAEQTDVLDLKLPILTAQLSTGLWGTYRRAAHLFGLITAQGHGGPRAARLNRRGKDLARALSEQVLPLHTHWKKYLKQAKAPYDFIARVDGNKTGKRPCADELKLLSEAMKSFDRAHAQALLRLRMNFERRGALTLDALDPDTLTERQRDARTAALGLRRLLMEIEAPYRKWVTGTDQDITIPAAIWRDEAWEQARLRGESEVVQLRDRAQHSPQDTMTAIHEHQTWLARLRAAPAWQQGDGDPTKARFVLPDFGLDAPARLFEEGADPR